VMRDVRIAYYEILENTATIAVRQEAVNLLTEELTRQKNRVEVGSGNKFNVLRAEVSLANEKPALIGAKNQLKNSYVHLSELLAIPYSIQDDRVPFEVIGTLKYQPRRFTVSDCIVRAKALRPEMKQREKEILIQEKQLTVDRSAVLPRLDLFAQYDVQGQPTISAASDTLQGYTVGVQGSWQIFDGLATSGRMKSTRARLAASYVSRDATQRSIEAEVLNAFYELQQAEATIESQTKNVVIAQESLVLAKPNFEAGLENQLDILQSRVDLTRAQIVELASRFAYNAALARLQQAISSNFKITEDNIAAPQNQTVQPKEDVPSSPNNGTSTGSKISESNDSPQEGEPHFRKTFESIDLRPLVQR
jgi:outer membrane protein